MSLFQESNNITPAPWKVLIVDDEEDVHQVTTMALKRFELDGRRLKFFHAYSGEESKALFDQEDDIALVLLDVVMEHDNAGLEVARWLREDKQNNFTRIVLRTGQPGQAPEEKVIIEYDINDYKEKTELDRKKLFTTVFSALRAYRDIIRVEEARQYEEQYRSGLERVLRATTHVFELRTMKEFFNGLLMQILSLLRINEQSMLVQVQGLSAVSEKSQYEILASIGFDNDVPLIDSNIHNYLEKARVSQHSLIEKDIFVGYFPSKSNKISLLYLKGINSINAIDAKLLEIFSANVSLAFENLLLNQEILDTQSDLIYRLGDVVESRSKEAGNHVRRMSEVSYMLGQAYGLDEETAQLLRQAAPMHDVGKISTPDAILLKPNKLDDSEWQIMKDHPVIGHKILSGSTRPILKAAATIAHQHHERYDGTGYPQGLQGENIDIFARIVSVADVFDALTHERCYKPAWEIAEVVAHMQNVSGSHLDPEIVTLLLDNLNRATARLLSTGQIEQLKVNRLTYC
jgi:response regulator RpfG family c-di-GMP phosphodiesterase